MSKKYIKFAKNPSLRFSRKPIFRYGFRDPKYQEINKLNETPSILSET